MATKPAHIQADVNFARTRNRRLLIRNTGHDFMGRPTGYGSLATSTHEIRSVECVKNYTGPGGWKIGVKTVGAGVPVRELYRLANQQNPTKPVIFQFADSTATSSAYCVAATDNALSLTLVTAAGDITASNADTSLDLFWALEGDRPSTFGAIVAVTVKTFPEVPTAGVSLSIRSTGETFPQPG